MSVYLVQALSGVAAGSVLFLISVGLTLVFGLSRVVNFAHGSFVMVGGYLGYTLTEAFATGPLGFWAAIALSALAVGALGGLIERTLIRRLYGAPELLTLLATFGVGLILKDAARLVWGPDDLLGARAPGLGGSVAIVGTPFPTYDLVLCAIGPIVLALLWLLFHSTRFGLAVRAATEDREITAALGIDPARLFTGVFVLGATFAGLGGALQVPRQAITLDLDLAWIVEAFVVVVIGGFGSLPGAFLAAQLIGQVQAFGILIVPEITLVGVFALMAVVLVVRPRGLIGGVVVPVRAAAASPATRAPARAGAWQRLGTAAAVAGLAALPLVADPYRLIVVAEALILALFAAGLHLLVGIGGLVSFGHAAYFGLGAYGAALTVHHLGWSMTPALVAAPLAAAAGAALFGAVCVRRHGIYLAMLTLAFAQILWSAAFQWTALTGGDNGILGIWPDGWAAGPTGFYLLTLAVALTGLAVVRRIAFSPFGFALRAANEAPARAAALGLPIRALHWAAFVIAGGLAGLAGGLYAFAKGSVFPQVLSVAVSVQGLVIILLGGLQALSGPVIGAAVFHGLETEIMRATELWRLWLGALILILVLAGPGGVAGAAGALVRRWTGERERAAGADRS